MNKIKILNWIVIILSIVCIAMGVEIKDVRDYAIISLGIVCLTISVLLLFC